jgi:glycosyltransferase involved in cell wall biosynthesis
MRLSVIITVFNEIETLEEVVSKVRNLDLGIGHEKEIIVVDNVSTDGTRDLIRELEKTTDIIARYQTVNLGKSNAFRAAIPLCTGDYIISQDADLEFDPNDIPKLLTELKTHDYDVVIGSRAMETTGYHVYPLHEWGVRLLTWLTNLMFFTKYTDVATCYKLMKADKLKSLSLYSNGFNLDFELCAKFSKNRWKVGEIPIQYKPRTIEEGRKIRNPIRVGASALYIIIRERLTPSFR